MDRFVRRCQELAGCAADANYCELSSSLRKLIFDVPPDLSIPERLFVHRVFNRTIACAAMVAGACRSHEFVASLLTAEMADIASEGWRVELGALAAACAAAIDAATQRQDTSIVLDHRVDRALRVIDARYADVTLSLRTIASAVGMSVFHLARLVKRTTGHSIAALIHRRRIVAARDLLEHASLSVKEIAAAVGYDSSSQFGRHFKRLTGTTPLAFRHGFDRSASDRARIDD